MKNLNCTLFSNLPKGAVAYKITDITGDFIEGFDFYSEADNSASKHVKMAIETYFFVKLSQNKLADSRIAILDANQKEIAFYQF